MSEPSNPGPIAVVGPGAIGCTVAAALIESGHEVVFAARTTFDRLELTHPTGTVTTDVACASDPDRAGVADIVMLAVKAHQTEGAGRWLEAMVGPDTTLVVLQNGVEHIDRVRPLIPATAKVVPAVVYLPAERRSPGVVEVSRAGNLAVPVGDDGDRLAGLVSTDFLSIRVVDDWTTVAWSKLMINAATGINVLTRKPNRALGGDGDARALAVAMMQEVAAVARAEGADLPDDRAEVILDRVMDGGGQHTSSILADRLAGNPTEWDARNAVVSRFADRHGIDVPVNRMITTLIRLGEPEST